MKPFTVADICMAFFAISWGIAGLAFAWCRWKESKYWANNGDEDDSGPDKPSTPYDIDPQFDPSDWWKKNDKERT